MTKVTHLFRLWGKSLMRKWAPRLKNRHRRFLVAATVVVCLLLGYAVSLAQQEIDIVPTDMDATINSMESCSDTALTQCTTLTNSDGTAPPPVTFSITGADPFAFISNFCTGCPIPTGNLAGFKVNMDCGFQVLMEFTFGNQTFCTGTVVPNQPDPSNCPATKATFAPPFSPCNSNPDNEFAVSLVCDPVLVINASSTGTISVDIPAEFNSDDQGDIGPPQLTISCTLQ